MITNKERFLIYRKKPRDWKRNLTETTRKDEKKKY